MLHVTNGDCAAERIRAAGLAGEIVPWRDVLHEGPVPAGLPLRELSALRARFIAGRGWGAADDAAREFAERDAALERFREHDEVVLWFEHDLYDQLQLAQVLDWLAGQDAGSTRLALVCGAEYLGNSAPERLAERFGERSEVADAELALAREAWAAFRAPDPSGIAALVEEDSSVLPFLGAALTRHLEQFPGTRNGLSRSEQQALEAIAAGAATLRDAYIASHQRREDPIWLGDATFVAYVEDLAAGPSPLVTIGAAAAPDDPSATLARRVALTDAGRAVLDGREDRIRLNGIDRWLGGVHLHGRDCAWRWDADEGRLVTSR
ncbi:DUF1835 domain-containing protein [Longimicrobium sp.]|uniref:DUF1835 domain-containing protein n=1 Tax=Longimicrobium sp. TaxID=2029185 RepID=UPI002CE01698|nr:DUF1835 domain-containing protein [Longimicrobium sp.]HSU15460.1 DUF1835 domain-containing protein [Longimicrobium sp.]